MVLEVLWNDILGTTLKAAYQEQCSKVIATVANLVKE